MYLTDRYDNGGKFVAAIAVDDRQQLIYRCRLWLTEIEFTLMDTQPDEMAMRARADYITSALAVGFYREAD